MIEEGIVLLIQGATGVNGFGTQLPKDIISGTNPKAWSYKSLRSDPLLTFDGPDPLTAWYVELTAYGYTMADAIALERAIDDAINGWSGTMTDAEHTQVQGIFNLSGPSDAFSDSNRSYVRTSSFLVRYIA